MVLRTRTESGVFTLKWAVVFPTRLPPWSRITELVVTWVPFRRTLGYGPASVMMLSASTVTFIGIALRPGNVMVHPDVVAVAVITEFVAVVSVPVAGTARTFHLPATSARFTGAGAAGACVVEVVVEDAMLDVSTAASSFLAHPARTTAQRQMAMLVERCSVGIGPPVQGDGRRFARRSAEPSERTAKSVLRQETMPVPPASSLTERLLPLPTCSGRPSARI